VKFSPPALITNGHDARNFDCGNRALNEYLLKYALANTAAGLARTFVTTPPNEPGVAGYFSIAAGSVERQQVPERVAQGTPQHPVPVALLARLAVDKRFQGQKLGEGLLKHALLKMWEASKIIGIRAILVHAKDQRAAEYYARHGFVPSPVNSLHLMLLMKDVAKTLGGDGVG
jgi:GNAT superfamily N-acetyltransferase